MARSNLELANILWSKRVSRFDHRSYLDAVPPIHAVSSHVATDKDPSK